MGIHARWASALLLAALVGCASRPRPRAGYAQVASDVQLAAMHVETYAPPTPPTDPFLEGPHHVDFYVGLAVERNPEILAARRDVAATAESIPQVTALDDPQLVDTFQPFTSHSLQTAGGRAPNTLTLSQRFPWLAKLRVRGEVAEQESAMALSRLAQAELKVVESVRLAYHEIAFNTEASRITEENETLLEDLLKIAEARYRVGQASQQDVLVAEVELEKLRDRLIALRRQLRLSQADLASLLHTHPESDLRPVPATYVVEVPESIELLYDFAVRCRPELEERFRAVVRDQRSRELATLQYYPDVTTGIGWQAVTTDSAIAGVANGNDNFAFTVGVTLPIWQDKLAAGVRQSEHRAVQSARRYDAIRDDTFRLVRRYVVRARTLEDQLTLFRDGIVPKAEQALRVSTADYRVGKVDFLQVVDNFTQLLNYQIQVVRLQASLRQTLASLERVVGCELALVGQPAPPRELPAPVDANDAGAPPEDDPRDDLDEPMAPPAPN